MDAQGEFQWHTYHGSADDLYGERAVSIAADDTGNMYVAAETHASFEGPGGEDPLNPHIENHDIFQKVVLRINILFFQIQSLMLSLFHVTLSDNQVYHK